MRPVLLGSSFAANRCGRGSKRASGKSVGFLYR